LQSTVRQPRSAQQGAPQIARLPPSLDARRRATLAPCRRQGFEKRVVYNASKAYVMQLRDAGDYAKLCDVVGVAICDFKLWPKKLKGHGYKVPMLSRILAEKEPMRLERWLEKAGTSSMVTEVLGDSS
jgi:hypothetical protein